MSKGRRPDNRATATFNAAGVSTFEPPAGAPTPPEWIRGFAREYWLGLCTQLEPVGVLSLVDAAALEALCQTYGQWREAQAELEKGLVIGGKVNPAAAIADRLIKQLRPLLAEFGLTPAARGKVKRVDASGSGDDLDKFNEGSLEDGD